MTADDPAPTEPADPPESTERADPAVLSHPTRLEATSRGRVQGVGFRYFIFRRGMELGLTGWVANESDGSVRCVAEGPRPDLEALLETMERGPAGAIVERVSATWGPGTGTLRDFGIRAGGHRGD
jgi:acylphosphatase